MTRMTRTLVSFPSMLALMFLFCASGCGPSEKDFKIEDLSAENEQLKRELNDRDRQLNDAIVRENEARDSIDELNGELARRRDDLTQQKGAEGWVTMPSFDMITVPGSVLFASGKANLTRKGRGTISRIVSDIRAQYADRDIYVFGHTDNQPIRKSKWKDNWELGSARSLTVVRTMQELGIPNENLVQANCSQFRPKGANASAKGRSKNRRVEIYAVRHDAGLIENATARSRDGE